MKVAKPSIISIHPGVFEALKALDTEIIPGLCRWYSQADSEYRAAFRDRVSNILIDRLRYGTQYSEWKKGERLWFVLLLNHIANEDQQRKERGTLSILSHVWSYAKRNNIDPVPLFRKLSDYLEPNEDAGVLVRQMLQSW